MGSEPESGEQRWEVYRADREPVGPAAGEPSRRGLSPKQAAAVLAVGVLLLGVRVGTQLGDDDEPDRVVTITRTPLAEDPFAEPDPFADDLSPDFTADDAPVPGTLDLSEGLPTVAPERPGVAEVLTVPGLRRLLDGIADEVGTWYLRSITVYPTSAVVFSAEGAFDPVEPYRWTGEYLLPDSTLEAREDEDGTYVDAESLRPARLVPLVARATRLLGEPATETALLIDVDLPAGIAAGFARSASGKEAFVFAGPDGTLLSEFTSE